MSPLHVSKKITSRQTTPKSSPEAGIQFPKEAEIADIYSKLT